MTYHKHARTFHLPWSEGISSDDKILTSIDQFNNLEVIVTEKRDGECTTLYPNGMIHARSISGTSYPWQSVIKSSWRNVCYLLPSGWRIVGENLYAQHSIRYEKLSNWLEVFAIIDDDNRVLSWDDTLEYCQQLDLTPVPLLWHGEWDQQKIIKLCSSLDQQTQEGLVVRPSSSFNYTQWGYYVGKWVRKHHVQTDVHWRKQWVPNQLLS